MKEQRKAELLENGDYFFDYKGRGSAANSMEFDFCGYEHCCPGHTYGPNIRENFVIHAVMGGRGTLDYKGKKWPVRKGQMFILFPGEEATYYADREDPWYYCWIGFHGPSAPDIVRNIGFTQDHPVLTMYNPSRMESIVRMMLRTGELTLDGQLRRYAGMLQILSDMIENASSEAAGDNTPNVISYAEYAVHYIHNHFGEKLRIQDLAKHIGISRSYLVKLMKQETGLSPQEYLIETRMKRAADMLSRSNDSVRQVAAECGYDDALAFSKAFKNRYGVNPSEYRHQFRAGMYQ